MSKKKVLYILHNVQLGGAEVALISAIPILNRKFNLKVLALGTVSKQIIGHLTPEEQKVFYTIDLKLYLLPIVVVKALRFVLNFNPDIIISSFWRASLVGALAKKIRPKICFLAFIHSSGFAHRLDEAFSRLAIRTADKILADSNATFKFITSKFQPEAPVDIVSFLTNASPSQPVDNPLNKDQIRFLFLGRINRVKNLTQTVDAIAYLRSKNINAQLDIYGKEDGEKTKIEEHIGSLNLSNHVTFRGEIYTTDKQALFRQYNFLIQLSSREGMAMSVAEAMQNGLVCVVTPVGEIANYAKDMETAVFMDTSGSTEWHASLRKLEALINNEILYKKIGAGCYENFRNVKTYADSLTENLEALGS